MPQEKNKKGKWPFVPQIKDDFKLIIMFNKK